MASEQLPPPGSPGMWSTGSSSARSSWWVSARRSSKVEIRNLKPLAVRERVERWLETRPSIQKTTARPEVRSRPRAAAQSQTAEPVSRCFSSRRCSASSSFGSPTSYMSSRSPIGQPGSTASAAVPRIEDPSDWPSNASRARARPEPEQRPPFARLRTTSRLVIPPARTEPPPTRTDPAVLRAQHAARTPRPMRPLKSSRRSEQAAFQRLHDDHSSRCTDFHPTLRRAASPRQAGSRPLGRRLIQTSSIARLTQLLEERAGKVAITPDLLSPVSIQDAICPPTSSRQGTLIPAILVGRNQLGSSRSDAGALVRQQRLRLDHRTASPHPPRRSRLARQLRQPHRLGPEARASGLETPYLPRRKQPRPRRTCQAPTSPPWPASAIRSTTTSCAHSVALILLSAVSAGGQLSQPQESANGGAPSARQDCGCCTRPRTRPDDG